jgi:hypothetical protein
MKKLLIDYRVNKGFIYNHSVVYYYAYEEHLVYIPEVKLELIFRKPGERMFDDQTILMKKIPYRLARYFRSL